MAALAGDIRRDRLDVHGRRRIDQITAATPLRRRPSAAMALASNWIIWSCSLARRRCEADSYAFHIGTYGELSPRIRVLCRVPPDDCCNQGIRGLRDRRLSRSAVRRYRPGGLGI